MTEPAVWSWSASGGDVAERLEWLTDVMAAPTGPEQRRRLREAPRTVLQFDVLEQDDARRRLEHAVAINGGGAWRAPIAADAQPLAEGVAAGATVLPIDARLLRFAVGAQVLLVDRDPFVYDVATVTAINAGTGAVTVAAGGIARNWRPGALVSPLVAARLPQAPTLARFTGSAYAGRVEFLATTPMDWTANAGVAAYRGAPVLEWAPDWTRDPEFAADRGIATVDNDTGLPSYFDQPGVAMGRYAFSVSARTRQQVADLRSLLYALAGRWAPIWIPSQADDLRVVNALASGSTVVDVQRCGLSDWAIQDNRRDIRIELVDGQVLYRRIESAFLLDVSTERLQLTTAAGVNAPASAVRSVQFLALCRQESDVNVLRYWSHDLVQTELTFRGVVHGL